MMMVRHTHARTHAHTHTYSYTMAVCYMHTYMYIRQKSTVKRLSKRKCTKENSMINGMRCVLHSYIRHVSCLRLNILFVDDSNHDLELCGAEFAL